jgi:hypothetical protein
MGLHTMESPSGEAQIRARFDFRGVTSVVRLFEARYVPMRGEIRAKARAEAIAFRDGWQNWAWNPVR